MTRTKTYEVMLLLDNREVKKGWDTLKTQIDGVLTKHGAKVVVAKRWDERKLAYEIKKQRRATYYLSYLEADPNSLDELERTLRLTAPVLRHLVLACEEIPGEAYEPEREFDLDKPDDDDSKSSTEAAKDGAAKDGAGKDGAGKDGADKASAEKEGDEAKAEASDDAGEGAESDEKSASDDDAAADSGGSESNENTDKTEE